MRIPDDREAWNAQRRADRKARRGAMTMRPEEGDRAQPEADAPALLPRPRPAASAAVLGGLPDAETLAVRCSGCGDVIPDVPIRIAVEPEPVYCDRCDGDGARR